MNKTKMKRKRKEFCTSPLLDDSPKRTKVHAQRKFAQGSNVNSPVITPIKELEIERPIDILPEPEELLPIKRPNTEDFLTFLCFRGTPILPPTLNFFNTASIVDTNGQVHKIKSDSSKNGPIDAPILKCGNSSEKPFIAFGVRKRADPIVISKQMDRKRRHALTIQALRREYQKQKMAKIRALTISKLSEKVTNKTLVRSNSVSRTETVTKKTNTIQQQSKTRNIKVIATKHVKVTTRTLKTLRPNVKQKMCLRSFRGRFVQRELPFRGKKKVILERPVNKSVQSKKPIKKDEEENDYVTDEEVEEEEEEEEEEKEETPVPEKKSIRKVVVKKASKNVGSTPKTANPSGSRITRSGLIANNKINSRIQQIKKRILLKTPSTSNAIVKRRALRSTTMKKTVMSQKQSHTLKRKQQLRTKRQQSQNTPVKDDKKLMSPEPKAESGKKVEMTKKETTTKRESDSKKDNKPLVKKSEAKSEQKLPGRTLRSPPLRKEAVVKKVMKKDETAETKKESLKVGLSTEKKIVETRKETTGKKLLDLKEDKSKRNAKEVKPTKNLKVEVVKDVVEKTNGKECKKANNTETKKLEETKIEVQIKQEKVEARKSDESLADVFIEANQEKKSMTIKKEQQDTDGSRKNTRSVKSNKQDSDNNIPTTDVNKSENNARVVGENIKENGSELSNLQLKCPPNKVAELKVFIKEEINEDIKKKSCIEPLTESAPNKETRNIEVTEKTDEKDSSVKSKDIKQTRKQTENAAKKDISQDSKRKIVKSEESVAQKSIRPSRKTKIAAAIYMEILSHKLVNESTFDDDNVSIDSFPELPNVKKTEQRENELKAKAKTSKEDDAEIDDEIPEAKTKSKVGIKKSTDQNDKKLEEEINGEVSVENTDNKKDEDHVKNDMILKIVEDEMNAVMGDSKKGVKANNKIVKDKPISSKQQTKKSSFGKRKSDVLDTELTSENESSKNKIRKTDESSLLEEIVNNSKNDLDKRRTRNSSHNKSQASDDSDESFHADVKIPRRKKLTRSKTTKIQTSPEEVLPKTTKQPQKKKDESSDSDQSTTSDVDLKTLKLRQKNKKFSKTKSMMKTEETFSDSDEEPLSKLTQKSAEGSQSSAARKIKSKKELKGLKIPFLKKSVIEQLAVDVEPKVKPKRECAKIPQNYLPMFSSSSDEEYFQGFSKQPEESCNKVVPKTQEPTCAHLTTSSDLLSKDVSRRFGKGKVNMSNEQIEKWLKESAMAGSSVKRENDEMPKFGEIIPTDTTLESTEFIDTQKLKSSLLPTVSDSKVETKASDASSCVTTPEKVTKPDSSCKFPLDRKLIFKKDKKGSMPNVNAFSPDNESSVYAFGEDNEPVMSTPFRRPSRRPSSTATSKSEDEAGKMEDLMKAGTFRKPSVKQDVETSQAESDDHFNIPQNPTKHVKQQKDAAKGNVRPKSAEKTFPKNSRALEKHFDLFDDGKYKVPSSPSASSSSSAKLYKRPANKPKTRSEICNPVHVTEFPKSATPGQLVEAPVFHPTEQEFQDPIEYIERIRHKAEQFGICRIVPPSSFKPECKVQDDMRFTAYNQYVHKMLHRWGPNFKELMAIKKYLATQNITLTQPPWIGGMEIDLPRLYQTVQTLGGLKEVIEKKKWPKVSELMKIPKSTQDRLTKLDDIYCKYLLPYDTLSPAEREKLFDEVETDWAKRESKGLLRAQGVENQNQNESGESDVDDYEAEDCIVKGRTIALNAFYRIARNTMSMHFKNSDPSADEVEQEFWKHVTVRQNHICVHSGSIDSGNWGYGFAVSKNSPFARHAWNLKVFTNNSGSVLRSLGPMMGVTVPTLHVGMVFSACCWYRDPHGLPWIEYLHTGGNKIWYGIPNSESDKFHTAVKKLMPNYCRNKAVWLTSDTAMIPPSLLMMNGVSLCRTVQEPGQFIVVFPKAFTSSISTGYVVSESVYFAPPNWLRTARSLFDELRGSCEPSMFSLDRLLLSIASDTRSSVEVLRLIVPYVNELRDREIEKRRQLATYGIEEKERMPLPEAPNARKRKKLQGEEGDYECETCRMNLFVSMVFDTFGNATYCIDHALELLESKKIDPQKCKFMFTYDDDELEGLMNKIDNSIEAKMQKKVPNKYAGMPTLLTK